MQSVAAILKRHVPAIELMPRAVGAGFKYLPRSVSDPDSVLGWLAIPTYCHSMSQFPGDPLHVPRVGQQQNRHGCPLLFWLIYLLQQYRANTHLRSEHLEHIWSGIEWNSGRHDKHQKSNRAQQTISTTNQPTAHPLTGAPESLRRRRVPGEAHERLDEHFECGKHARPQDPQQVCVGNAILPQFPHSHLCLDTEALLRPDIAMTYY